MASLASFARGAVPTSSASAYTVDNDKALLKEICLVNTTGAPITATFNIVPSAGSAQTSNQLYGGFSIPANSVVRDQYNMILLPGDQIFWQASGAGLNAFISGAIDISSTNNHVDASMQ